MTRQDFLTATPVIISSMWQEHCEWVRMEQSGNAGAPKGRQATDNHGNSYTIEEADYIDNMDWI